MSKEALKVLVVIILIGLGVPAFLAVLGFLVSDQCLDSGGAVGDSWWVCMSGHGRELPWFVVISPWAIVVSMALVALPALIVGRVLFRRIGNAHGTNT